ncbi:MAG: DUF1624 domain-containing protein [Myxococcaceae bacterium]|nr:MAG: DUF1624 domain-containing protein [Myxococcaceae bacterium]
MDGARLSGAGTAGHGRRGGALRRGVHLVPVREPVREDQPAAPLAREGPRRALAVGEAAGDSSSFNAGRLFGDTAQGWVSGTALPAAQFFTRWITHLCAPTFLFLAGYSLFISVQRRKRDGASEAEITRSIAARGLLVAALDPLWMVFVHKGELVLQVLYAIGVSMLAMAFLRRLPARVCGALGLLLVVLHEALARAFAHAEGAGRLLLVLTLVPGRAGPFPVSYPVIPWLAAMLLGWAAADLARRDPEAFRHRLVVAGIVALAVFAVVRGLSGYGNAGLFRDDGSLVQWLHTAKYPASLAYLACELGIAWLLLSALWTRGPPRATPGSIDRARAERVLLLSPARPPLALRGLEHGPAQAVGAGRDLSLGCGGHRAAPAAVRAVPPVQAVASGEPGEVHLKRRASAAAAAPRSVPSALGQSGLERHGTHLGGRPRDAERPRDLGQDPCPKHSAARTASGTATPDHRQASLRQAAAADSCSVGRTTGAAPPAIPTRRQAPSRSSSSFPSARARAPSFPTDSQDRTSTEACSPSAGTSSVSFSMGTRTRRMPTGAAARAEENRRRTLVLRPRSSSGRLAARSRDSRRPGSPRSPTRRSSAS